MYSWTEDTDILLESTKDYMLEQATYYGPDKLRSIVEEYGVCGLMIVIFPCIEHWVEVSSYSFFSTDLLQSVKTFAETTSYAERTLEEWLTDRPAPESLNMLQSFILHNVRSEYGAHPDNYVTLMLEGQKFPGSCVTTSNLITIFGKSLGIPVSAISPDANTPHVGSYQLYNGKIVPDSQSQNMFNTCKESGKEVFLIKWPSLRYSEFRGYGTDSLHRSMFGDSLPEFSSEMDLDAFIYIVQLESEAPDSLRKYVRLTGSIFVPNGILEEGSCLFCYIDNELRGVSTLTASPNYSILIYASYGNRYSHNMRWKLWQNGTWFDSIEKVSFFYAGNIPDELDLHFGINAPTAFFMKSAWAAPVGTPVSFDPSGSFDSDGLIVQYEWDWETDGVFDEAYNSSAIVFHTYTYQGYYTVTLRVTDNTGLTNTYSDEIIVDATPPEGSIQINNEETYTKSTSVTLSLTSTDATSGVYQVRFSNDGSTWSSWESPSATKDWSLISGDGAKTVYYQIKDNAGLVSITYSDTIILDTTSPQGSIKINNGAAYTNAITVNLALTATDATSGVAQMRFSNNNVTWSYWETYTSSTSWNLQNGDGAKNVIVQYKDNAGLVSSYNSSIMLDTTAPVANAGRSQTVTQGTSVTFNANNSTDNMGIVSYYWDFGDDSQGSGITVSHSYSDADTYLVELVVQDLAGNNATATVTIVVQASEPSPSPSSSPTPSPEQTPESSLNPTPMPTTAPSATPTPVPSPSIQPTPTPPPTEERPLIFYAIIVVVSFAIISLAIFLFRKQR
jgi:PKD repeat protein